MESMPRSCFQLCFLPLLAILICTASANTFAQNTVEEELQAVFTDHQLMGLSVLFFCEEGEAQEYHFGLRDYARELPVDSETKYRVASVSKLVTASGCMLLVEQGLADLDEDISAYLGYEVRNPSYPEQAITLRMLLSHTSSLQDGSGYSPFLNATYSNDENVPSIAEVLLPEGDFFTSNMWRTEAPGSHFAYSNINYGLIATVMEAVSNTRFDIFMREQLFEPLGLTCSYNVADLPDIDHLAVLYRNQSGWTPQVDNYQGNAPEQPNLEAYQPGTNGSRFAPQGGLRASASELGVIMDHHRRQEGMGLSQESFGAMQSPEWTFNGNNGDNYFNLFNEWGLGVHSVTGTAMGDLIVDPSYRFLGHPGEAYGLISDLYFSSDLPVEERNFGFVLLTNGAFNGYQFGNNSAYYTLEEDIFEVLLSSSCTSTIDDLKENNIPLLRPNFYTQGEMLQLQAYGEMELSIFDSTGKSLVHFESYTGEAIPTSAFTPGVYHLQLSDPKGIRSSQRFIIY